MADATAQAARESLAHSNEGGELVRLTASTTLLPHQRYVLCDTSGGAFTVTLPSPGEATEFTIVVETAGNILTVAFPTTRTNLGNVLLEGGSDSVTIKSNGADYYIASETRQVQVRKVSLVIEASSANGGCFNWQNPESVAVYVTGLIVDVRTKVTAASVTLDAGAAATAGTKGDNLIDGLDISAAAIVANSEKNAGTNGLGKIKLDANGGTTDWITGTALALTADTAGLVGKVYIYYHKI